MEKFSIKNAFLLFCAVAILVQLAGFAWIVSNGDAANRGDAIYSIIIILVVSALVLVGFSSFVGAHYAHRAERIVQALHALANGDLTCKLKLAGKDDFAWLAYEYDSARKSLLKLASSLQEHTTDVSNAADRLAVTSTQLADSTQAQSKSASTIASAVQQIAGSVGSVSDQAFSARSLTTEAGDLSRQGSAVIQQVVAEVREIAAAVEESAQLVRDLGAHSQQIRSIVGVIAEVADQTNLLALNAAIEAARAGEQGRGFAVVADEVRKLAERTAGATKEISNMIEIITRGTESAVISMQDGVGKVAEGVTLANSAADAIARIDAGASRTVDAVGEISMALEQQKAATVDIARNIESIAQMAETNNAVVEESRQTSSSLTELAGRLQASVARFKISA